ncbi:MAG: prepilin peptidase [Candidatus Solibacter usitatus]|nr:prepilin peptidase [Candidatus Solibacter usitatus]
MTQVSHGPDLPQVIRVTLSAVLLTAAATDLRWRRIPNWLTLPALPVGLTAQAMFGEGFWQGLLGALAGFAALFLVFAAGGGGAGDVKLFAVVGAFVGVRNLLPVFVLVAVAGGLAAVLVSLRAGAFGRVLRNTGGILSALAQGRWAELKHRSDLDQPGGLRLAYGAVIAAGTLIFLWYPR